MTLFSNQSTFWPPLYTLLIKLFNFFCGDLELSGRFVSILAGSICVYPVYWIGKLIFNRKVAIYTAILYIFSPVVFRWNLRVMSDSLFTLLFLGSLVFLLRFYFDPEGKWLLLGFFGAGLASLTRYEGIALIPLIMFLWIREIDKKRYKSLFTSLWGLFPWLLLGWWLNYRGFGHFTQHKERMAESLLSNLFMYLTEIEGYILTIPYILTYPIFIFFCYGAYKAKNLQRGKILLLVLFYLLILWLITHSTLRSFQTRYFLPLVPLFLILAGYGLSYAKRGRLAFGVCLGISIIFSSAVLFYQRDTFGEVQRASLWIKYNVKRDTIFSDELHKTQFWSGKKIKPLESRDIRAGDYLVIHSFYSPLSQAINYFQKRYEVKVVYQTTSSIIPLLSDLVSRPEFTNSPRWLVMKYQKQTFRSVVLKIIKEKNEK
ncbi:MAG TPA: hypothetical protein EYP78_04125 [Candidatus Omnitrophica bacterium]|nr:hypothetical protein [Candidatus Omnitrophota bacterium]